MLGNQPIRPSDHAENSADSTKGRPRCDALRFGKDSPRKGPGDFDSLKKISYQETSLKVTLRALISMYPQLPPPFSLNVVVVQPVRMRNNTSSCRCLAFIDGAKRWRLRLDASDSRERTRDPPSVSNDIFSFTFASGIELRYYEHQ